MCIRDRAVHRGGVAMGSVLWCAGDGAWLGTQVHGVYGPLAAGETAVVYEGTLDVPTLARAWQLIDRYAVSTLMTTPSVLRSMRSWAGELGQPPRIASLRRVVSFGEPVDAEIREWARHGLASGEVSVADGWGQVELAGITRLDNPVRAGGMPDLGEAIVDRDGLPVPDGAPGELVVTRPWAGLMVGLDAPSVLVDREYWERAPGAYATGDRARILPGWELEFLGRTDEVVSVSGQLVSLMEIRGLLADHPFVSAVDVIERRDHAGGRYIAAAVVLTPEAVSYTHLTLPTNREV